MALVSVIVPNYNHARFLTRRLDTILAQTFRDYELLVFDDASTDDSRAVIARYLSDPRVRFYPNERNSGSAFAQWNRGVDMARGKFVWIAESDDFAAAGLLAKLVGLLKENPRVAIAYCQSLSVDANNKPLGSMYGFTVDLDSARWLTPFVNHGRDECSRFLLWKNTVPNASAALLRRDVFVGAGGAPTDMRLSGDWMTWARMLSIGDIAFTPEPLNYFRHHDMSLRTTTSRRRELTEAWLVQQFILRTCRVDRSERRRLVWKIFHDVQTQIASVRGDERWTELREYMSGCWPILGRAPETAVKLIVKLIWTAMIRSNAPRAGPTAP